MSDLDCPAGASQFRRNADTMVPEMARAATRRPANSGYWSLETLRIFRASVIAPLVLILPLQACNSSTSAVESAAAVPAAEEAEPTTKVIRQEPTVAQKGTYIRVLVNGDPITNFDVQRRQQFRKLRRLPTGAEATLEELVDERIKIQEARRRGMLASDSQVNQAFENFAKGNRSTPARISSDLDRMGVGASHFKEFIRAQISWSRAAGSKIQADTRQKSQSQAIFELRKAGQAKPETTEYLLQQIIFVVPEGKSSLVKARMAEAQAFRQRYEGCDKAFELAKSLRDVAVKDLGRKMQPELPKEWADKVSSTEVGKLTEPTATEKGVEMIGVCRSRVTSDDRAAQVVSQAQTYETLEQKGNAASDEYLAELKKTATIIYR